MSPPVSPSQSPPAIGGHVVSSPARSSGSLERNQSLPASVTLEGPSREAEVPISRLEKQASAPAPSLAKSEEGWASFEKTVEEGE